MKRAELERRLPADLTRLADSVDQWPRESRDVPAPTTTEFTTEPRGRHGPARQLVAVGIGVATVLALIGVVLVTRTSADHRSSRVHTANPGVCGRQIGCPIGPGQFLYVESETHWESDQMWTDPQGQPHQFTTVALGHRQIWFAADGSARLVTTSGTPTFRSPADREVWVAAGSDPAALEPVPPGEQRIPPDPAWVRGNQLPTATTDALRTALNDLEGGSPGPGEDWVHVGDLLRETNAPYALRLALYRLALTIPGVTTVPSLEDRSGRAGIGLAFDNHGTRLELVLDPHSYALLGEQGTVTGPNPGGLPVGADTGWAVYRRSGIVDSDTAVP